MARRPPLPTPTRLSTLIRAERIRRAWTQPELARRVGELMGREVKPQTISRWENDRRGLTVQELGFVAQAMGLEPRQLLPGTDGLGEDERALIEAFRAAPPHERRAMLGMAVSLHEGRSQAAFEARPTGRSR